MIADPMHQHHHMGREGLHQRAFEKGDHPRKWNGCAAKWKAFFAIFAVLDLGAAAAEPPRSAWRVWLEPKFMHQPVSAPIANAQRTEFVAGTLTEEGFTPLPKGALETLGVTWDAFAAEAKKNAEIDLADVKTTFIRNRKKVIQYAELHSEKGLLASAVLAPKFAEPFLETLGPTFLLVVPNRSTAYAFPKLVTDYQDYVGEVLAAHRATAYPVSLEVFEVTPEGLRAVALYRDPSKD
jgi:hypothetical protein